MALFEAIEDGDIAECRRLLDQGETVHQWDFRGCPPLHNAARNGHAEICSLLLDRGACVNAVDHYAGYTPLISALFSESGPEKICRLLLAKGAAIDQANDSGMTALHAAALEGLEALCVFLLDQGAAVGKEDLDGETLLHWAAIRRR